MACKRKPKVKKQKRKDQSGKETKGGEIEQAKVETIDEEEKSDIESKAKKENLIGGEVPKKVEAIHEKLKQESERLSKEKELREAGGSQGASSSRAASSKASDHGSDRSKNDDGKPKLREGGNLKVTPTPSPISGMSLEVPQQRNDLEKDNIQLNQSGVIQNIKINDETDTIKTDKAISDKAISDKTISDKAISDKAISDKAISDDKMIDKNIENIGDKKIDDDREMTEKNEGMINNINILPPEMDKTKEDDKMSEINKKDIEKRRSIISEKSIESRKSDVMNKAIEKQQTKDDSLYNEKSKYDMIIEPPSSPHQNDFLKQTTNISKTAISEKISIPPPKFDDAYKKHITKITVASQGVAPTITGRSTTNCDMTLVDQVAKYVTVRCGCDLGPIHDENVCQICKSMDLSDSPLLN